MTHGDLDGHHSSTAVSKVAESARNSNGARLGVHAIFLVHWRTNVFKKVVGGDSDRDGGRNFERFPNAGGSLAVLFGGGLSGGGWGGSGLAVLLLDLILNDGGGARLGGGSSGGSACCWRYDLGGGLRESRLSDILNDLESGLAVYLRKKKVIDVYQLDPPRTLSSVSSPSRSAASAS